jgi:hypothetical protein
MRKVEVKMVQRSVILLLVMLVILVGSVGAEDAKEIE